MANGVIERLLRLLAKGRVPRKGALFRLLPITIQTSFWLHTQLPFANTQKDILYRLPPGTKASFVVVNIQANLPLWEQWVQVLYTDDQDNCMVGWLPYHEFCRLVRPEWELLWEEDETP
jgi:hypothetical protein